MIRKGRTRFFSVVLPFCLFFAFVGVVQAQEGGVFNPSGASVNEGPFEFEFEGGVKVLFDKIFLNPHARGNEFIVQLTALSEEDAIIKLSRDKCIAFDNVGNRFAINNPPWHVWIANENIEERLIIGGVPTRIWFVFIKGGVELADSFARIDLNIMGKIVTLRNVPTSNQ